MFDKYWDKKAAEKDISIALKAAEQIDDKKFEEGFKYGYGAVLEAIHISSNQEARHAILGNNNLWGLAGPKRGESYKRPDEVFYYFGCFVGGLMCFVRDALKLNIGQEIIRDNECKKELVAHLKFCVEHFNALFKEIGLSYLSFEDIINRLDDIKKEHRGQQDIILFIERIQMILKGRDLM